jgi:hypothetical protein
MIVHAKSKSLLIYYQKKAWLTSQHPNSTSKKKNDVKTRFKIDSFHDRVLYIENNHHRGVMKGWKLPKQTRDASCLQVLARPIGASPEGKKKSRLGPGIGFRKGIQSLMAI